jgi:hypothetical protein
MCVVRATSTLSFGSVTAATQTKTFAIRATRRVFTVALRHCLFVDKIARAWTSHLGRQHDESASVRDSALLIHQQPTSERVQRQATIIAQRHFHLLCSAATSATKKAGKRPTTLHIDCAVHLFDTVANRADQESEARFWVRLVNWKRSVPSE